MNTTASRNTYAIYVHIEEIYRQRLLPVFKEVICFVFESLQIESIILFVTFSWFLPNGLNWVRSVGYRTVMFNILATAAAASRRLLWDKEDNV